MTYRKITVRGIECLYVVGKTHVKIQVPEKGSRAFPIEQVGTRKDHVDFNEMTQEVEVCGHTPWAVTPKDIERKILGYFDLTSK